MEQFAGIKYERGDLSWAGSGRPMIALEPPCGCADCDQQFRSMNDQNFLRTRYRELLSREEAEIAAGKLTSSINRDLAYLQQQCAAHGNAIINRWKKRSREKRGKILLKADPDMYSEQFLLPRHLWKYQQDDWPKVRERHKSYLVPYINVPDLRDDPAKFLSLLMNRVRFSPAEWAPYDNRQLTTAWFSPAFDVDYCHGSIIMQGSKFGQVTEWNKSSAENWTAIGYPRGSLILEAQQTLMSLLRRIVELLLEGIDENSSGASDKWVELSKTGFKLSSSPEYSSPFLNQPFSPPPTFNIDKILSIAQAKMNAAGDHLWLLQTDPAYMRRAIASIGQGHISEVASVTGSYHNFVAKELYQDHEIFLAWSRLWEECEYVKGVISRFPDNVHPGEPLPPKVDRALGALELMVVNQLHVEEDVLLNNRLQEMSTFRDDYYSHVAVRGKALRVAKPNLPTKFLPLLEKDPLHFALTTLVQTHADKPDLIDHTIVYSILDDYLEKSPPAERGRLTERLYNAISDTAALQEILNAIRLSQPLNTSRALEECFATEDRRGWQYLAAFDTVKVPDTFTAFPKDLSESVRLIKAFEAVPLPTSGRVDQSWVDSLENRHTALNAFWKSIRTLYSKDLSRYNLGEDHLAAYLSILEADSQPDYINSLAAEKAKLQARITARKPTAQTSTTVPNQPEWAHSEDNKISSSNKRKKKKTRPEDPQITYECSNDSIPIEKLSLEPNREPVEKIIVKQQTATILTRLFSSDAKTVDWDAFVNAMDAVGFPATQTGNGSAVSFEADENRCRWKGSINFHRPHPVAKIDPVMLHAMGKRMNKWFDWEEDMFEVAAKD